MFGRDEGSEGGRRGRQGRGRGVVLEREEKGGIGEDREETEREEKEREVKGRKEQGKEG